MASENPEKELLKYFKQHTEPTYICRLKLEKTIFKCVISCQPPNKNFTSNNQENKDDDCIIMNEETFKNDSKSYKVTSVECNENSVKMKISSSVNDEISQPRVLLDTINLENYSKSPQKYKNFTVPHSKKNFETNENTEKNRRKQILSKKMYNTENCDNFNENIFEIENVVKKIKDFGIVTPKKNRRIRTKSIDSVENEPVKKTPRKTKKILDLEDEKDKTGTAEKTKAVNKVSTV